MTKSFNSSNQYGQTRFTVSDTPGKGSFTTIAEAVNASSAAGGGGVYIFPGAYTESITWPSNVVVSGDIGEGSGSFKVNILGNQTFSIAGGSLAFQGIAFTATSGDAWTVSGNATTFVINSCLIFAVSGGGIISTSAELIIRNSNIIAGGAQAINALSGTVIVNSCTLGTGSSSGNTVDLQSSASINANLSTFTTPSSGSGSCIASSGATTSVTSTRNVFSAGNLANASAFIFTVNGGTIKSTQDQFTVNGTFLIRSGGGIGAFTYGGMIVNAGTSTFDPLITSVTSLDTLPIPYTKSGLDFTVSANPTRVYKDIFWTSSENPKTVLATNVPWLVADLAAADRLAAFWLQKLVTLLKNYFNDAQTDQIIGAWGSSSGMAAQLASGAFAAPPSAGTNMDVAKGTPTNYGARWYELIVGADSSGNLFTMGFTVALFSSASLDSTWQYPFKIIYQTVTEQASTAHNFSATSPFTVISGVAPKCTTYATSFTTPTDAYLICAEPVSIEAIR